MIPPLLFLFYFCFYEISAFNESSTLCDSEDESIVWNCVQNPDNTLNITIDCLLNKVDTNSAEIQIWSSKFPMQMKVLTIQNCDNLTVNTSCNTLKDLKNFQYLEIRNISNLILGGKNELVQSFGYSPYYYDKTISTKTVTDAMLPAFTTFRNIQNTQFNSLLNSADSKENCINKNHAFKSLEFVNVTLNHLKQDFIGYSKDLTNFLMDNVTISNIEATSIVTINNDDAMLKITNSKFPDLPIQIISCSTSEVTFSHNTFGKLQGFRRIYLDTLPAFKIKANKFSLIENVISYWGPYSFRIDSPVINITNNTFYHIDDYNANYMIMEILNKTTIRKSCIFSHNIIHTLTRKAFATYAHSTGLQNFDYFDVSDNLINCSCESFPWFDYMARHELDTFESHTQLSKWFSNKNNNKCSNVPKCTLNQVLYNHEELCEDNYTCVETHVPYDLKNSNPAFNGMLNSLKEIVTLNSKMLTVLSNGKYVEKIVEPNQNYVNKLDNVEAKKVSETELSYHKEIYSCLVLISCLTFIMFAYHVFTAYSNCSYRVKYFAKKKTQSETELTL